MTMRVNLYVGGKRIAVQAEEAASIVERFERESKGNEVYKLDMSCRQWKGEAFDILKPFLEKVASTVRFLNVADIIAGLMTDEGLHVTETLAKVFESSNLNEIDLSDNAMGDRGLLRVESLFTNSNLQRLYLSNCGLSAKSMEMLKDSILADDGRIAKSLTELVLDKNMIGVDGAKVIGEFLPKCKKLEYFSYNGCRPIKDGTKYICEGLRGLTQEDSQPVLSRLDMEDCTFGSEEDDAIIPFAEVLKKCSQLSYLNIKDNDLGVDGLKLLVDALTTSRAKLTHLYLGTLSVCLLILISIDIMPHKILGGFFRWSW
jgi:Ran GTPase-activating protein 1